MKEVVDSLLAAPEYVNPAIALAAEVMQLEAQSKTEEVSRLLKAIRVEEAVTAGEVEGRAVLNSLAACGHAPPTASKTVPVGF